MDKFVKNAAIYLAVKSEKEDYYFISEKLKKMKECCTKKDIEITQVFIVSGIENVKEKWGNLKEQIKKNKIQVLVVEEKEEILLLDEVEIEEVYIE